MRNNKGFTLIELLVVVAIIGILAAVGTVAYTGYTEGAKKSSAKSNHASVVKYIAAEDQKCNVGAKKAFGKEVLGPNETDSDKFDCENRTGATVVAAAVEELGDFKNPYATSSNAVRDENVSFTAEGDRGYVNVVAVGNTITVTTCFDATTEENDKAIACKVDADRVVNEIDVAE